MRTCHLGGQCLSSTLSPRRPPLQTARLELHLKEHPLIGKTEKQSFVWDYIRYNMRRLLAWKVLQGYVDVDKADWMDDKFACFLRPPQDHHVEIDFETKGVPTVAGSYVVWNGKEWVRSGKAIDIVKRRRGHEKDKNNVLLESRFYKTIRCTWNELTWFQVLALSPTQASAACKALFMDAAWETKLEKTKWGGPKKTGKERQVDMLCYLSELLDELLMDKMMVVSDSPGFEAPLGVHCK